MSDGGTVVGIVTDRDLALRVVAAGRDPRKTRLGEIMSSPLTTLDGDAPHADALRLMRERNIRRVPIVERNRVVGMVTLDDLSLERTATLDEIAEVVRSQIRAGGPARTRRFDEWTSLARRHARALGTSRQSAEERIARELGVGRARGAEIARAVGAALAEIIPASAPVGRHLSSDLRTLLRARKGRRTVARRESVGRTRASRRTTPT